MGNNMERETKTIKLSNCEVDIITYLTWGEKEVIQNEFLSGAKIGKEGLNDYDATVLMNAKYKLLEIGVKEIRNGDIKTPYSKEWINNLSVEDGDLLYTALEEIGTKKK